MEAWLIQLSTQHAFWVYLVIILTACAEGPILSMIFGVLIKLGYFPFVPIYAALMFGDLLGDSGWYWVGRKWGHSFIRKFGKYVSVSEEGVAKITQLFHRYHNRILVISKITNGFGFGLVTLITAGMVRVPFFKYLSLNLIGQFVWSGLLLAIGYYFSSAYIQINNIAGKIFIVLLFVVLIFVFVGFIKFIKKKSEKI